MYGGNPFSRRKRSKSNNYPDFFSPPKTSDPTLKLLNAASRKLRSIEKLQKQNRSQSSPPRSFYSDPGQQYFQPFIIPSALDTSRYISSDSSSRNNHGSTRSYQSSPKRNLIQRNTRAQSLFEEDERRRRAKSQNGEFHQFMGSEQSQKYTRSPSHSVSTVAHDSPHHRSSNSTTSSQISHLTTPTSFSLNAAKTPGGEKHYRALPQQQQQQQQRNCHQSIPPSRLTVLLCDPTGGRAILRAKINRNSKDCYWELVDMFSLHNTQGNNEITEKIDAIFLCAKADEEAHGPQSLDIAITQLVPFHFQPSSSSSNTMGGQQQQPTISMISPVFVIMVETQPHLIRSPSHHDRTISLARHVRARDVSS
jgi:hypothetical protein